ncbi:MAG: hypothetical protein NT029_00230 [Armatimonadetes bacterium]|nr:hypothetical protein [Armatimonadota bacterium]
MRSPVCTMLVVLGALLSRAAVAGPPTIDLRAVRQAALSDGRDYIEIVAEVRDSGGTYLPDGTRVTFTTSRGVFVQSGVSASALVRSGSARVRVSSQQKGVATVTASVPGGGFQRVDVTFTDDPAETYQGNSYVRVQARGSVVYSVAERTIEATSGQAGRESRAGVTISYRAVTIEAKRAQVDCASMTVRAQGAIVIKRGGKQLKCGSLAFILPTGVGYAIAEQGSRWSPVKVSGAGLKTEPEANGIAATRFEFLDLSDASLVVVSKQVRFFPGEKLQFVRPRFFQDGQQVFSLPFYSLSYSSRMLFTDQFISVGSQGFGLDVPLYYTLTPSDMGQFRVRYGERTTQTSYARRGGWSLDMVRRYTNANPGRRYTGEFTFLGANRRDWGMRWNHSQEFSADTRTSLYMDMPQHRGFYGGGTLQQRFGGVQLGLGGSANRSLTGLSTSGSQGDAYLETLPVKVKRTGYMVAVGANVSNTTTASGSHRSSSTSRGLQARFYSRPWQLDRLTSVTNSVALGHQWTSAGRSGASTVGSLIGTRALGGGASLQMTYDYSQQGVGTSSGGSHRTSASLNAYTPRSSLSLLGTYTLDAAESGLVASADYQFVRRWRLYTNATVQRFAAANYSDVEFGISRSLGGRDVMLSFSTFEHRVMLDLVTSRY